MPSRLPKLSVPGPSMRGSAPEAKRIAPLSTVRVLPELIVSAKELPSKTSELMVALAATAVAAVRRVLCPATMALLVNSSVGLSGRSPVSGS